MLRHALVPIDTASETEHAIRTATQFAAGYGSQITGLYVRETCSIGHKDVQVPQTPEEKAMGERQSKVLQMFRSQVEASKVDYHLDIECGDAPEEIARASSIADIIVMAPPGGKLDLLESLVKNVPHPIIAVREQVDSISRLGVAFDGSRGSSRALGVAADIVANWKQGALELVLIESSSAQDALAVEQAKRYLEIYAIKPRVVITKGTAADSIVEACNAEDIDILCMGAFGTWSMKNMLLGSVSKQVLAKRKKPILMCH